MDNQNLIEHLLTHFRLIVKELPRSTEHMFILINMQIMNVHGCDGTDIQCGEAKLNRTFHLSVYENISTITRMKNIHYYHL